MMARNACGRERPAGRRALQEGLLLAGTFFVACYVLLSLGSDPFDHGDVHTDGRAVVAARQFNRVGYSSLHFIQVEDGSAEVGIEPLYYVRHPCGGPVFLGLLMKAGLSVAQSRFLPLLFSALGILGFHLAMWRATRDRALAVSATIALASLAPIYLLADALQFYSYSLFAKGLGAWLAVGCVSEDRRSRRRCLLGGFVLCAATTFALGLETLPAIGLFSFVFPLLTTPGSARLRLSRAISVASVFGAGMLLGVLSRMVNILPVFDWDLPRALDHFWRSVLFRSVGGEDLYFGRSYLGEMAYRLLAYMPLHLAVAGAGVLLWLGLRLAKRGAPPAPFLVLGCALVMSELPYFFVMRQHVHMHVHTAQYLAFTVAAFAGWGFEAWRRRLPARPAFRVAGALFGVALVVLSLAIVPLRGYGNIGTPASCLDVRVGTAEIERLSRGLPANAVILLAVESRDWLMRYLIDRAGFTFVSARGRGRVGRLAARILTKSPHPLILLVDGPTRDSMPELCTENLAGSGFALVTLGNDGAEGRVSPSAGAGHPASRMIVRLKPTEEVLRLWGGLSYPLLTEVRDGSLELHAPPVDLGATVTSVDLPGGPGVGGEFTAALHYRPRPNGGQPPLELEVELFDEPSCGGRRLAARKLLVRPGGERLPLALELAEDVAVASVRVSVQVAPGSSSNRGAAIRIGDMKQVPSRPR